VIGGFFLLLQNSFEQFRANSKTVLIFALLLVFVPIFSIFQNIYISSGSVFLDYNLLLSSPLLLFGEIALLLLFLVFYSFFASIVIFGVRKNLSSVRLQFYLHEMLQKFTLRIFVFFALYCLLLFLLTLFLLSLGMPIALAAIPLLLVSFVLQFVPQAVVVDEEGLRHALLSNFDFLAQQPVVFLKVAVIGAVLLALVQLLEFALIQVTMLAPYISLLLVLVLVQPFIEIMKTYQYMMRFELIKEHEAVLRKKPHYFRPAPLSLAEAKP